MEGSLGVEPEGQAEGKVVEQVDTDGSSSPALQQSDVVHAASEQRVVAGYGVLPPVQGKSPQVGLPGVQHSLVEQMLLAQAFVEDFEEEGVKPAGQVKLLQVARAGFAGFVLVCAVAMEALANKATTTTRCARVVRIVIVYVMDCFSPIEESLRIKSLDVSQQPLKLKKPLTARRRKLAKDAPAQIRVSVKIVTVLYIRTQAWAH